MKIGVSTGLFNDYDLVNLLPILKRTGFNVIEVGTGTPEWNSHSYVKEYDKETINGLIQRLQTFRLKIHSLNLREKLKDEGIEVHSLHTSFGNGLDISSPDEDIRLTGVSEVKKNIDLLSFLDGRIAIIHPGGHLFNVNDNEERKRRLQKSALSLKEILEYAQEKGIKIAVENLLPHLVCGYAHEMLDLIERFDSANIGICFDSSHANLAENPQEVLRKFTKKLFTVHISDNHGQYDEHLIPGEGKINFIEIVKILKEIPYEGVFILEVLGDIQGKDPYKLLRSIYSSAEKILAS